MDTVADFLTQIRNAGRAKREKVDLPSSNLKVGLARVLEKEGFIRSFKVAKDSKQGVMRIYLKYSENGDFGINEIHRVSRPGRRHFVGAQKIPKVRSGRGIAVLSTNKGVLSGKDAALNGQGGELLCVLW